MEFYIARQPVFNRRKEVFGYKLQLCQGLRKHFYDLYREPDDAEELYRQLCFAGFDASMDKPLAILEFSEELFESLIPLLPRPFVIVEYNNADNSEMTDLKDIKGIRAQGYKVLYDATVNLRPNSLLLADFVKLDYAAMSLESQHERLKNRRGHAGYLACGIETWDDYKKALEIGYDYFQGSFFLKPLTGKQSDMRSFNTSILRVISELGEPETSFKEITNIIEHDLNLSYRLLRLVNSAYIAPKFKVKTISQAVTILGLNELNKFMSTIIMKQMQSPENNELLRCSLIRGKFMELLAGAREMQQKGSEAFFAGIFSLLDVILNRSMEEIMDELPLTDTVKETLLGRSCSLKELLDMVRLYEQARWEDFDTLYSLDSSEQEQMMNFYITALKWAESFDF